MTWRAIKNLVSMGKIPELADLSPEKAASVLFAGVYGIGPGKAKDLYVTNYLSLSVNEFPSPFADRLRKWDFGLPLGGV